MKAVIIFLALLITKIAFGADGGEHAGGLHVPKAVMYQAINVAMLIGLLYYLTHKKIKAFFTARGEEHEKAKQSAQRAYQEAQQQHQEITKKLETLRAEEPAALARAESEAKQLKSKLILEAEKAAQNIAEDAKKTSQHEFEKAKQSLRGEALEMALTQAKQGIEKNLNKEDQKGLQKQFVENIGTVQ